MLRSLTDVVVAFIELLEVEARALGRGAKRVGLDLALLLIGALVAAGIAMAGAGFLIAALYMALRAYFWPSMAALLTGVALWIVIGVAAWIAVSAMRRRSSK